MPGLAGKRGAFTDLKHSHKGEDLFNKGKRNYSSGRCSRRTSRIFKNDFLYLNKKPSDLITKTTRVLKMPSDTNNWSEYQNIDYEVGQHLENFDWYLVYDIIETIQKPDIPMMLASTFAPGLPPWYRYINNWIMSQFY